MRQLYLDFESRFTFSSPHACAGTVEEGRLASGIFRTRIIATEPEAKLRGQHATSPRFRIRVMNSPVAKLVSRLCPAPNCLR